jgi:thymidylate kinase
MLITFSGLDGAGKSTLIHHLKCALESRQRRVRVLTMYDDIGVYAWIRNLHCRYYLSDRPDSNGTTTPSDGVPSSLVRFLRKPDTKRWILPADLLLFLARRWHVERAKREILILDRYFYDALAELAEGEHWRYVRAILAVVPRPELPLFIDVLPEEAYARKAQYPLEHLTSYRARYQRIFQWVPNAIVLRNEQLDETVASLTSIAWRHFRS